MRVVSMVPSWTETLLEAGRDAADFELVGRTRYCVHPADLAASITAVGGTKEINWDRVSELKPDLVIFDREENPKSMADRSPYPWLAHPRALLHRRRSRDRSPCRKLDGHRVRPAQEFSKPMAHRLARAKAKRRISARAPCAAHHESTRVDHG